MERRLKLLEFKKDLEEGIQKLEATKTTAAMLGAAEMGVTLRLVDILLME